MSQTITLTGNLLVQLTANAKPQPVPINQSISYTEKAVLDFSFASAQTNLEIPQGTISAPRFVYVEVESGTFQLSWVTPNGTGTWDVAAPLVPPSTGTAPLGQLFFFTFNAPTKQLYLTTPGAATGKIWLFE